jgi:hypothetical protein
VTLHRWPFPPRCSAGSCSAAPGGVAQAPRCDGDQGRSGTSLERRDLDVLAARRALGGLDGDRSRSGHGESCTRDCSADDHRGRSSLTEAHQRLSPGWPASPISRQPVPTSRSSHRGSSVRAMAGARGPFVWRGALRHPASEKTDARRHGAPGVCFSGSGGPLRPSTGAAATGRVARGCVAGRRGSYCPRISRRRVSAAAAPSSTSPTVPGSATVSKRRLSIV